MAKPTHAAIPGTGPVGEACFTCGHAATVVAQDRRRKPVPTCGKVAEMTRTRPSDCGQVRASDRACRYWTRRAGS
ncbi:MAG: hypothetical protein HQL34_10215 [Alphaproteobacteria bacterium]|nr:hypothetical protein [Alphaproteobacteria bacterium]